MTTFAVGIFILFIVLMALGKSLFPGRAYDATPGDGDYPQNPEDEVYVPVPDRKKPTCKRKHDESRTDDFVSQFRKYEE